MLNEKFENFPLNENMKFCSLKHKQLILKRRNFIDQPSRQPKEENVYYKLIKKFDIDNPANQKQRLSIQGGTLNTMLNIFKVNELYSNFESASRILAINNKIISSLPIQDDQKREQHDKSYVTSSDRDKSEKNIWFINDLKEYKILEHNVVKLSFAIEASSSFSSAFSLDHKYYQSDQAKEIFLKIDNTVRFQHIRVK